MDPTRIAKMFGIEPATWSKEDVDRANANLSQRIEMWHEREVRLLDEIYVDAAKTTLPVGEKVNVQLTPWAIRLKWGMCIISENAVEGRDFEFV